MLLHHLCLALLAAMASPAAAVPAATSTTAPAAATATNAWVSVAADGSAHTVTPVLTTIDGTPTVLAAEPAETEAGATGTTTAQAEATATSGAGAFPVCHNTDGVLAPFCAPSDGSTLHPGGTYYITWDPSYFSAMPNTTVVITGNLFNASTGDVVQQAFSSGTVAAGWSFYAWTVDAALLQGAGSAGVNVSLSMVYLAGSQANASLASSASTALPGPVVTVAKAVAALPELAKAPTGPALYIGLPAVLAFVVVVLAGTFLWNRHRRHIGLGNVMSRSRFGPLGGRRQGYGIRKSRRQRAAGAAVGAIHLDDRFRDDEPPPPLNPPDRPRRDSEVLGSLAGTPTDDRFDDVYHHRTASASTPSTGNAFRDELARQQRSG